MLKNYVEKVREKSPLIHNITNYVTVNDCANILIACGGSPIMADDIGEVEDITSICSGLNINIGTLNSNTIKSMLLAGRISNNLDHPTLLDPVGAGASKLRTETAHNLINEVKFSVIRGNISEMKALVSGDGNTKGVDADVSDCVTDYNLDEAVGFAKRFSAKIGSIIAITGAIDIVADSKTAYVIRTGNAMMSKITGTGCMLSAMTTAYIAANSDNLLEATAASVMAMGVCGERAYSRLEKADGNASYRNYIIDEVFNLNSKTFEEGVRNKYEIQ